MKRCIVLKCISKCIPIVAAVIAAVMIAICLCLLLLYIELDVPSQQTSLYELEFYTNLLYALDDTDRIYIENLVPVEWDTMKVFTAYATKDNKIDYAGYTYANGIHDITHEDVLSLIFTSENEVVYYVDVLVPRMFDTERISTTEIKLTLNDDISALINLEEAQMVTNWGYSAEITETHYQNKPYFDVLNKGNGSVFLTIKDESILNS